MTSQGSSYTVDEINKIVPVDNQNGSDLGQKFNNAISEFGTNQAKYVISPGTYNPTTTVDLTENQIQNHVVIEADGAYITADTNGDPFIDFTGHSNAETIIRGGRWEGGTTNRCSTMFLLARSTNNKCEGLSFSDVRIDGEFTEANLVGVQAEDCKFWNCRFNNDGNSPFAVSWTDSNVQSITSPNATVGSGNTSTGDNSWLACRFGGHAADTGVVQLDGTKNIGFSDGFMSTPGGAVFYFPCTVNTLSLTLDTFGVDNCTDFLEYDNSSGSLKRHDGLTIRGVRVSATNSIINSSGANFVQLQDSDIGFSKQIIDSNGVGGSVEHIVRSKLDWHGSDIDATDNFLNNLVIGASKADIGASTETNNVFLDTSDGSIEPIAGYAGGDAIQSVTLAGGAAADSVTSSTYTDVQTNQVAPNIFWNSIRANSSVTMQAYMTIDVDPNNDQIDVRLQNTTDGETIIEQTGTTGGSRAILEIGPTDYTPTTTGSKIEVRLQARNSDDSTTVTTRDPFIQISPKV